MRDYLDNNLDCYTQTIQVFNVDEDIVPLEQVYFTVKPLMLLDGINQNRIYDPLGTHRIMELLRILDTRDLDLSTIAEAKFARDIINQNTDDMLDQYILRDGISDIDSLMPTQIPVKLINSDKLTIPNNLKHHRDGLEWLQQEIETGKIRGEIPINSLVSIKNLQWLSSLKESQ